MTYRVAIIPARGGSRRIKRKNIKDFHGQPIIAYSIKTAIESGLFDRIIVSTDDPEIGAVGEKYGVEYLPREKSLCNDEVGTQTVMQAVLRQIECDVACCIYPCSPLMKARDLNIGIGILEDSPGDCYVMSVGYPPLQDAGQWYLGARGLFVEGEPLVTSETRLCRLPPERVCDINTPEDWTRAEQMYLAL